MINVLSVVPANKAAPNVPIAHLVDLKTVSTTKKFVPIALLDFSQRLLQQQTAQHAHKDLHRRLKGVSSAYHAFLEHLIILPVVLKARTVQ